MRHHPLRHSRRIAPLVLAAALLSLAWVPARADEPADLSVQKLTVRRKPKADTFKLQLALPLDPVLDTVDLTEDALAIRVNDHTVFALPPAAERERLREKKALLWKYRAGHRGPKLSVDLAFRKVKLVVPKAELDAALDSIAQGIKIALDLGDRTFETIVDLDERGRVLKLHAPEPDPGTPPDDPGGGGGNPVTVSPVVIAQTWDSGVQSFQTVVARTDAEWASLWARHTGPISPGPPRPSIDFSSRMVVAVFLGNRPDPSHSVEIARIRSDGATTSVEYSDVRAVPGPSGSCFFPAVVTQPTVIVSVPKTASVTFSGRILQRPCP